MSGRSRDIDMSKIDPDDIETVAGTFSLSRALAREIVYFNDEYRHNETPEDRFARMRKWIERQIKPGAA